MPPKRQEFFVHTFTYAAIACGILLAAAIARRRHHRQETAYRQPPAEPLIPQGTYKITSGMDGITLILDNKFIARIEGLRLPKGDTFGEVGFEIISSLRGRRVRIEPVRRERAMDLVHAFDEETHQSLADLLVERQAADACSPLSTT